MATRLESGNKGERRAQEVWEAAIDRSLSGDAPPESERHPAASAVAQKQQRKRGELLMRVRVDLGGGRTETILFHRGDGVRAVALDFVRAHSLGDRYAPVVGKHIERNLSVLRAAPRAGATAATAAATASSPQARRSAAARRSVAHHRFTSSPPIAVPADFVDGNPDAAEGEEAKYARLKREAHALSGRSHAIGGGRARRRVKTARSVSVNRLRELSSPVRRFDHDEAAAAAKTRRLKKCGGVAGAAGNATTPPVFNRLFKSAAEHQTKLEALQQHYREVSDRGVPPPPQDRSAARRQGRATTDRLYEDAAEQRRHVAAQAEELAAERSREELEACTFKPHVTVPDDVQPITSIVDRLCVPSHPSSPRAHAVRVSSCMERDDAMHMLTLFSHPSSSFSPSALFLSRQVCDGQREEARAGSEARATHRDRDTRSVTFIREDC